MPAQLSRRPHGRQRGAPPQRPCRHAGGVPRGGHRDITRAQHCLGWARGRGSAHPPTTRLRVGGKRGQGRPPGAGAMGRRHKTQGRMGTAGPRGGQDQTEQSRMPGSPRHRRHQRGRPRPRSSGFPLAHKPRVKPEGPATERELVGSDLASPSAAGWLPAARGPLVSGSSPTAAASRPPAAHQGPAGVPRTGEAQAGVAAGAGAAGRAGRGPQDSGLGWSPPPQPCGRSHSAQAGQRPWVRGRAAGQHLPRPPAHKQSIARWGGRRRPALRPEVLPQPRPATPLASTAGPGRASRGPDTCGVRGWLGCGTPSPNGNRHESPRLPQEAPTAQAPCPAAPGQRTPHRAVARSRSVKSPWTQRRGILWLRRYLLGVPS
ncbi:PREDICTED: basic salivary proline-rich protein 2-like [Condylura cristata]|uniref:basic salivary proline-rich protein 2-like n=1 Tax=Condylura cristata TaxID=143302 RepID=UPI000642A483|nr:PREDICTED: basic salivary proline-rich protein 2-like [Condylura cristata]